MRERPSGRLPPPTPRGSGRASTALRIDADQPGRRLFERLFHLLSIRSIRARSSSRIRIVPRWPLRTPRAIERGLKLPLWTRSGGLAPKGTGLTGEAMAQEKVEIVRSIYTAHEGGH